MFRWTENTGQMETLSHWRGTISVLVFEVGLADQHPTVPQSVCHAGKTTANRRRISYQIHAWWIIFLREFGAVPTRIKRSRSEEASPGGMMTLARAARPLSDDDRWL